MSELLPKAKLPKRIPHFLEDCDVNGKLSGPWLSIYGGVRVLTQHPVVISLMNVMPRCWEAW